MFKKIPNALCALVEGEQNGFQETSKITVATWQITQAPLIQRVLSTVDPARYTNCYVCMYVCKSSGREFHAVGPATTAKARRPKVRRWRGTERRWRLAERRRCRQKYVFQKYVADAWPHFIWEIGHTGYHIGHALFLNFVVRHTCDTVDIISTCQTRSQPSGNGGRFPQILDF